MQKLDYGPCSRMPRDVVYLCGIRFIVTTSPLLADRPKLRLSDQFPCTYDVRMQFNSWLLEQFGTKDEIYIFGPDGMKTAYVSPKVMAKIVSLGPGDV